MDRDTSTYGRTDMDRHEDMNQLHYHFYPTHPSGFCILPCALPCHPSTCFLSGDYNDTERQTPARNQLRGRGDDDTPSTPSAPRGEERAVKRSVWLLTWSFVWSLLGFDPNSRQVRHLGVWGYVLFHILPVLMWRWRTRRFKKESEGTEEESGEERVRIRVRVRFAEPPLEMYLKYRGRHPRSELYRRRDCRGSRA
jgi:hypothetical protein